MEVSRPEKRYPALERAARTALRRAHSPYSKVKVGAALLAADGRIFTGCNVENASYGLTLCAERVAVAKAVSEGAKRFVAIVITANTRAALMPCGACRQTLQEFAPRLRVMILGPLGAMNSKRLDELLPHAFGRQDLR